VLNMFRTLICPSSGAWDCAVELPHRSFVLGSLCVGDLVRLGLSGVCVAGCSLQHGHHPNPAPPNLQHTTNREQKTDVAIQQHSRKLLMMDILTSETCWAHKKWNKIASDKKLVVYSSAITMTHGPIHTILQLTVSLTYCDTMKSAHRYLQAFLT